MKYKLRYKAMTFISLAFLALVVLASCSHTKVTASIDGKSVYAKSGNYSITNKELWDELKWNSYDIINEKTEEAILKNEMAEAALAIDIISGKESADKLEKAVLKRYLDFYETKAIAEIYAGSVAEIEDIKKLTSAELTTKSQTFADNVYLEDAIVIDASKFDFASVEAKAKKMFADTKYEETYYFYDYYYRYKLDLAKKIYSNSVLADEIEDHDEDVDYDPEKLYYTDEDILQYQKENYQYSADRSALIIRFNNQDEINSTLKAYGIKVYENNFYYIPANGKKNVKYGEYYDDFVINEPKNSGLCVNLTAIGGDALIFELYLQIYNYIYTYRDSLPTGVNIANDTVYRRDITEAIIAKYKDDQTDPKDTVAAWDAEYKDLLVQTQEELNKIDDDFKLYVSKTLKVNPDVAEGELRYSTEGKTYGDYAYMVFKVSEDPLKDWYYLAPEDLFDETNPTIDVTSESVKAYKQELIEEMMWEEMDDSFVENRFQKAKDKTKVYIYDNDIEILYSYNKTKYSKTHKDAPTKSTLFTVVYKKNKTNVSVNEIYDELEKTSGATTAIDLLSKKAIKDTEQYKKTNEDRKEYKENIELLLTYFANGGLSGYSSSLGKYNFLKLYFHTTDVDKIIDNVYRVNEASAKILTDYANNNNFYKMVQKYAKYAYDKSFTISSTNLLVYVDMDEDGKADTDFDWNTVEKNSTKTYKELAVELINKFLIRINNSTEATTTLSTLVSEYNGCQRFTNGIDVWEQDGEGNYPEEYDPTQPESRWAVYKRAGLYISSTDYSGVSQATVESSADSTVPSTIVINKLHELYSNIVVRETYPTTYIYDEPYVALEGFMDKNGYSLIVVTSATERSSSKFESKDDVNGRYTNIVIEYDDVVKKINNIYNDKDAEATLDQITLFVYEYLNYSTSEFFPSSVQSYITNFVLPVYQRYTADASQRVLLYNKMLNGTITFTNTANGARLNEIMEINQRSADSYLANDDESNLFPDWWTEILTLTLGGND